MSTPPDSSIVEVGSTAGAGFLAGVVAKYLAAKQSTNNRLKSIEKTLDDRVTKAEFNDHRAAIKGLITDLNAKADKIDQKLDTTAEALQFIRGQLNGGSHTNGRPGH